MKQSIKLITILFAVLLFAPQMISAQELSIGYVDPQSILARMPETKAVQQRLQNFLEQKQNEVAQKEQEYNTERAKLQDKIGVISPEAQQREVERIGQMQVELLQFRDAAEQAVSERQATLLAPLFSQIQTAINAVAARKSLTYVLNTTTTSGDVIILYASESARTRFDITMDVMQELGIFD